MIFLAGSVCVLSPGVYIAMNGQVRIMARGEDAHLLTSSGAGL